MTSGVKPALPQMALPKGRIESKASYSRALPDDFANALDMGKASREPNSADGKPVRPVLEVRPEWPRLAVPRNDVIAGDGQRMAEHEAAAQPPKLEVEGLAVRAEVGESEEPAAEEDAVLPAIDRHNPDAAPQPMSAAASGPVAQQPSFMIPARSAPPAQEASSADAKAPSPAGSDFGAASRDGSPQSTDAGVRKPETAATPFVPMGGGEQADPVRFEPVAARPTPASAEPPPVDRPPAKDVPPEPARTTPRVTMLAQQNIPAPMPSTALALVETIAAGEFLETATGRFSLDAIHASASHVSAQSLKIQLHPAELGTVTATLRFAGEQLSIELKVENQQAYSRLSSDSDTIVNALRDLGYEIDRVTVLQPQIAISPATRADTPASMPSPQGRSAEQFGAGMAGGGGAGSGGRHSSDGANAGAGGSRGAPPDHENAGGALYI
jgi:hypothetical protein